MVTAKHILFATDFSDEADEAVGKAGELARSLDAKLTVLHVHGHPPEPPEAVVPAERLVWSADLDADAEQSLENLRAAKLADVGELVLATIEHGTPARAICEYAGSHDVDLIALGRHGRNRLVHVLFARLTEKVVKCAPCDVLVVPPDRSS